MDEASRCTRVGYLQRGRLELEGRPSELRKRLGQRIVELVGRPLPLLRQVASQHPDVEEVLMFGDRLHVRVLPGRARRVMRELRGELRRHKAQVRRMEIVEAQLEDVFLAQMEAQA
jgi:ABC-type multidrug transport system ATPase subunit